MQNIIKKPALWLIVLIIALPQLSETIYTPSLPGIAHTLAVSESMVEYTLTIYLFGFAIGVLLWGNLSDRIGRRPALLIGLFIYLIGCLGCWLSENITALMLFRFIQAFGGSTGSVLGQAIARDAFAAHERGKVFSTIGVALAGAPALGPIIGGYTDQLFGWSAVFLVLIVLGISIATSVFLRLPETNLNLTKQGHSLLKAFVQMGKDRRILSLGFLVGASNGIVFSLYSEGPFYMINMLGLTPSQYGSIYLLIGCSTAIGGFLSRYLHTRDYTSHQLLWRGCFITLIGALIWVGAVYSGLIQASYGITAVVLVITFIMINLIGIGLMIPNALGFALENYSHMAGTAASIFGFYYYLLISIMTFGMGWLHDGTVWPMPLYFTGLAASMLVVYFFGIHQPSKEKDLTQAA